MNPASSAGLALLVALCVACSTRGPDEHTKPAPAAPVAKEEQRDASDLHAEAVDTGPAVRAPRSFAGKTVLHVGDSMVGGSFGLTRALERKFVAAGARFHRDSKVSESILSFDRGRKPSALLARFRPDVVIITLGTNDVFLPNPDALSASVERIAARVGARECYWMGPPLWKQDTGIVGVIKEHTAGCVFFDPAGLELPRAGDGIHPTEKGGVLWADAFWTFLETQDAR